MSWSSLKTDLETNFLNLEKHKIKENKSKLKVNKITYLRRCLENRMVLAKISLHCIHKTLDRGK